MAGGLGKKIETWHVQTEAGEQQITVYMVTKNQVQFTAVCETVTPRYFRTMADINELKTDATRTVKQTAAMVWEKRILVETNALRREQKSDPITKREHCGRQQSELSVCWQVVEIGIRPDGKNVHRYLDRDSAYGNKQIMTDLPDVREFTESKGAGWLDNADTKASVLLPYTPENVAALTMICDRLAAMALQIASIMGPAQAAKTLVNIRDSGVARLGFATAEPAAKQKPAKK